MLVELFITQAVVQALLVILLLVVKVVEVVLDKDFTPHLLTQVAAEEQMVLMAAQVS
jgi:hypothetical protein